MDALLNGLKSSYVEEEGSVFKCLCDILLGTAIRFKFLRDLEGSLEGSPGRARDRGFFSGKRLQGLFPQGRQKYPFPFLKLSLSAYDQIDVCRENRVDPTCGVSDKMGSFLGNLFRDGDFASCEREPYDIRGIG